jgi:hypothetical protein
LARLDHDRIEIVRRLAVPAQLQIDLLARVRWGQDLTDQLKSLRVEIVAGDAGHHHHGGLRLKIPYARGADGGIKIGKQIEMSCSESTIEKLT